MHVTPHTPFDELPQFLSVEEFRIWVGIGRSSAYDLLRREELMGVRFGRVVRIPKAALRSYLRMHGKGTGHDPNN
jgi:excisionase family DNA binding protein